MRRAVLVGLTVLPLVACASSQQAPALEATRTFQSAVASGDTATACALLAEESRGNLEAASASPCSTSLPRLTLAADPPQSVEVWGDNAQVRTATDVLFLAKFSAGWKVTAVGCRPRPDKPYDCKVEG